MTDIVKVFKNGKVEVRRGGVTATVDPRKRGIDRWFIEVRPPAVTPGNGYSVYYGPFYGPFQENGSGETDSAITEQDAVTLHGNPTTEDKLAMARKMLDWHFQEEMEKRG